jgi:hypothetical protein
MFKPQIGTVSHGTLRIRDLTHALVGELEYLNHDSDLVARINEKIDQMSEDELEVYWKSEDANFDLDDLYDELNFGNDLPYVYFGSHEGDGSDIGWWILWEAIEEDIIDGLVVETEDIKHGLSCKQHFLLKEDTANTFYFYNEDYDSYSKEWTI